MPGVALAISTGVQVLTGVINLMAQLQKVSSMLQAAQAENRDLTDVELAELQAIRKAARQEALDT
jgi:cell division septal protein FtsQ